MHYRITKSPVPCTADLEEDCSGAKGEIGNGEGGELERIVSPEKSWLILNLTINCSFSSQVPIAL
jgi:hypothetical protein